MRYEIHKYFPNPLFPGKSAWATQEVFEDTNTGYESMKARIKELRVLDKTYTFRAVFVDIQVFHNI